MSGENYNYKFGPKNNWRRWAWNRITERLAVPARDAIVLYLAGKDDLDRAVAREHGFSNDNLIAIDKSNSVVEELRTSGKLAIMGDFHEVLKTWGEKKIHVLFYDSCCGIIQRTLDVIVQTLLYPCLSDSVIVLNMLRGREQNIKSFLQPNIKHRGIYAHYYARMGFKFWANAIEIDPASNKYYGWKKGGDLKEWLQKAINPERPLNQWVEKYLNHMDGKESLFSYNSTSGQVFDSCIWNGLNLQTYLNWISGGAQGDYFKWGKKKNEKLSRQITAIRAVRSRYINERSAL